MSGDKIFSLISSRSFNDEKSEKKNYYVKNAFKLFYNPKNTLDLISIKEFIDIIQNGFIFIQYRKDSVYHLSNDIFSNIEGVKYSDTHEIKLDSIINKLSKKMKFDKKQFLVIDSTRYNEKMGESFSSLSGLRKYNNLGVCIRANIEEIELSSLEYFDILFLFDMSDKIFDRLRSFISIPSIFMDDIRSGETTSGEPVLVFINYKRVFSNNAPVFSTNPFIVSCDSSLTTTGKIMSEKENKEFSVKVEGNDNSVFTNIENSHIYQNKKSNNTSNNFEELKSILRKNEVQEIDINNLKLAISQDEKPIEKDKFGNKVSEWMANMLQKSLNGTWALSIGIASSLLATALSRYYGLA